MRRTTDAEMSCREFVEMVTEYLEGALDEERRAALHAHMDECGGCSTYLEQIRLTISGLAGLAVETTDPELRDAALEAFRERRGRDHLH